MDYKVRKRIKVDPGLSNLKELYPRDLQLYDSVPTGEIPLVEFQELGLERLKALRMVESNSVRTDVKSIEERREALTTSLKNDGLRYFAHILNGRGCKTHTDVDLQARKKDHMSHFIMRLAYCQDPERKKWLINQEIELFKLRFSALDKDGVKDLLSTTDLGCTRLTSEERDEIRDELCSSTPKVVSVDTTDFYKVSFKKVLDLIKTRKVYINQGKAFIPQTNLDSLFISYFRQNLQAGVEDAKTYLMNISDDQRLNSYLKSLPGSFSGMTRVVWSSSTTPIEKLDELSKTSYPMCMRTLHEALRTNHHLKHSGRMQYGLFIKGIGVTLEDSLRFWREEITKTKDADKFDREYGYNIRHNYGKEGKQTNYTPYSCQKIILASVGPGEYHGCPYRHMDKDSLKQKLSAYGLPPSSIMDIVDFAKDGQYLNACTKYFETMHGHIPSRPIIHPNSYFQESRNILSKNNDTEEMESQRSMQNTFSERQTEGTPSRRFERSGATPSRNTAKLSTTPSRSVDGNATPSRRVDRNAIPSRRIEKINDTPAKKLLKTVNINEYLNDDEIAALMDEV